MSNPEEFQAAVEPPAPLRTQGAGVPRRRRRKLKRPRQANVVRDLGGAAQLRAELIVNEQARAALQARVVTLEGNLAREAEQRIEATVAARHERITLEAQVRSLTAQLAAADVKAEAATAAAVKEALQKAGEEHLAGIHSLEQHHQARYAAYRLQTVNTRRQLAALEERISRNQIAAQELQRHNQQLEEERTKYRNDLLALLAKFERARNTCKKWEQETTRLRSRVRQLEASSSDQPTKDN